MDEFGVVVCSESMPSCLCGRPSEGCIYALQENTASLLPLDIVRVLKVFSGFLLCGIAFSF